MAGMGRKLRLEYRGAVYHVMNRGDRREAIFRDGQDGQRFLSTLGEAGDKGQDEEQRLPGRGGQGFIPGVMSMISIAKIEALQSTKGIV